MIYFKTANPPPMLRLLDYDIRYWKHEGIPRHGDNNERIDTPASKIYYYNKYVLKNGAWNERPNTNPSDRYY